MTSKRKQDERKPPKQKPTDEVLTTIARELVDELEQIELRRWEGWMDQMHQ